MIVTCISLKLDNDDHTVAKLIVRFLDRITKKLNACYVDLQNRRDVNKAVKTHLRGMLVLISFFYCSPSGVQVVSPSRRWYRPPVAGIALSLLVSPSHTTDN